MKPWALDALDHVLVLLGVRRGAEVRRDTVLEAFLGDLVLHVQPLAELEQLVLGHLLDLVGGVAALEALAECQPFTVLARMTDGMSVVSAAALKAA